MSEYIEVGQPLQFTDPNTPTRVGEIVENVSDIYNIPSPRLGMQVFVKSEKKSFVITSLKSKVIGGVDVPEAAVEAFEPVGAKSITWNNDTNPSNMNDFVVAGVYDIKGERTRANDNLPVLNTGGGHTFNARLTVLDSSIERTEGEPQSDDKCITQVLSFSNRLGQGEVYIRTGKGVTLNSLTWENWSTLQRNVNVVSVESLDDLIDNGIYSGVLNPTGETFVLVVINNYALASRYGLPKSISQFKYSVSHNGVISFSKRVKAGDGDFPEWEIINYYEITLMINAAVDEMTAYTQDAISTAIEKLTGAAPDTLDTLQEIAEWVSNHQDLYGTLKTLAEDNADKINDEITRAKEAEKIIDDKLDEEIGRSVAADQDLLRSIDEEARRATEAEEAIVENTDKKIATEIEKLKDGDTIVAQTREIHSEDGRSLVDETRNFLDKLYANTGKESSKDVADYITTNIAENKAKAEEAPNLALRALYIAAGAEYNDTETDKTKTAPWGETVTHKAGHYYLNGLGDITEEQMKVIYNAPHNALYEQAYAEKTECRTFFFNGCSSSVGLNALPHAMFVNCRQVEVLGGINGYFYFTTQTKPLKNMFKGCKKLRVIGVGVFYASNITIDDNVFSGCESLEYIKMERLQKSLSMKDCSQISKFSIKHMIENATPTSAITITLHADAYARLKDDADIVAALAAQPLVTLVSA